jgi:hypothetical protein
MRRELGEEDRKLILMYAQNYLDYTAIYLAEEAGTPLEAAPDLGVSS